MRGLLLFFSIGCAVLLWPADLCAGLYHDDVLAAFDLDENGFADPDTVNGFLTARSKVLEADNPVLDRALKLRQAIAERKIKGASLLGFSLLVEFLQDHRELKRQLIKSLPDSEIVAQALDLLRFANSEDAIRLPALAEATMILQECLPTAPPEGLEFLVLMSRAYLFLKSGEAQRAYELAKDAFEYPPPKSLSVLAPEQRTWYRNLEKNYYVPLLLHRKQEIERLDREKKKLTSSNAGLDPIFFTRVDGKKQYVQYISEDGEYQAGRIAEQEASKLPPDAIAIIQQLILWDPTDARLVWQLAELYNAIGDLRASFQMFELCTNGLKYTNAEIIDHRKKVDHALTALLEIEAALRANRERVEQEKKRLSEEATLRKKIWVAIGVIVVVLFLSYWQGREILRRRRRSRRG